MDKIQKYLMLLLIATLSVTFTACGDDDDEPVSDGLAGTSWKIISDKTSWGENNGTAGSVITFQKDGSVKLDPGYSMAHLSWSMTDDDLKIVWEYTDGVADTMTGKLVINGKQATYSYHWVADADNISTMILERQ